MHSFDMNQFTPAFFMWYMLHIAWSNLGVDARIFGALYSYRANWPHPGFDEMMRSASVVAETSVRSPRQICSYHYLEKIFLDQSIQKRFDFILKTEASMMLHQQRACSLKERRFVWFPCTATNYHVESSRSRATMVFKTLDCSIVKGSPGFLTLTSRRAAQACRNFLTSTAVWAATQTYTVLLFKPKYRSSHPENYLFSLSGSKYAKHILLILKTEALDLHSSEMSWTCAPLSARIFLCLFRHEHAPSREWKTADIPVMSPESHLSS